jgi:futalosine hydrolase
MTDGVLKIATSRRPALLVVAAATEADALLDDLPLRTDPWRRIRLNDRLHIVIAGVGKANAAGATAFAARPDDTSCILSVGLAGALPGSPAAIGDLLLADASPYADEGVITPDGFQTCAQMGFPLATDDADLAPADPDLLDALRPLADHVGPVATVSTCSGTDHAAETVRLRTGALAEAMEGAGVLVAALRLGIPAAELRVISNTTGDRRRQRWDLPQALSRLRVLIGAL